MARVRRVGSDPILPPTRGPSGTPLGALLGARSFRLGAGAGRVAENLALHGGGVAGDAAAWIGAGPPPADSPSISLGEHAGTLGPRSYGFLNNVGGVAALNAPLPSLPRRGGLALVVPGRDALPDLGPLCVTREVPLSWLVSVGDGDPAEVLRFLGSDPATTCLAVALGPGADGASLRAVAGLQPTVLYGGDQVTRAVARHAGAQVVDRLDAWLARATLLSAGVVAGEEPAFLVLGGGRAFVEGEVRGAGLRAEVRGIDERDSGGLEAALQAAQADPRPVLVVAGGPVELPASLSSGSTKVLRADLRHPEHLVAIIRALAERPQQREPATARPRVDRALIERVRSEVDTALSDHDAKRLLKGYGVRVTRQAPSNTPTGAVKLARAIGTPVVLVAGTELRVGETLPEVRRLAALLLQGQQAPATSEAPSPGPLVMVREYFPEVPRAQARIAVEKGIGPVLRVGDACAVLPLTRTDAQTLAGQTAARRAADQRAVADLLGRVAACALAEDVSFELELFVGAEPTVLTAAGTLRRGPGAR